MRIIVFGVTGDVGSRVAKEAVRRGHDVVGVVRKESRLEDIPDQVTGCVLNLTDEVSVANAIAENDIVVSALRPPDGREADLPAMTKSVLDAAREAGKRTFIVGGAANLLLPDNSGLTVLSAPNFLPASVKPIAAACFAQFRECAANDNQDWIYFSPPPMLRPGERTGRYRRGSDFLIVDDAGSSQISMEDFAVAILDEAETLSINARRVTVAY